MSGKPHHKDRALWKKAQDAADKAGADDKMAFAQYWYLQQGGELEANEDGEVTAYGIKITPEAMKNLTVKDFEKARKQFLFQKQASATSGNAQLVRSKCSWADDSHLFTSLHEATVDPGKKSAEVIIISEGPGNQRDRNYYTREFIESAVEAFNGARCYLNHATDRQRMERPEGDVRELAGFFKNTRLVQVQNEQGKTVEAVGATLQFDDSEAGCEGCAKAKAAVDHKTMFPMSNEVYAGLSINAGGVKEGTVEIDGQTWNKIVKVPKESVHSADIVTRPARGGAFVSLTESAAASLAHNSKGEVNMKVKEAVAVAAEIAKKSKELTQEKDEQKRKSLESELDTLQARLKLLQEAAEAEDEDEDEAGDINIHHAPGHDDGNGDDDGDGDEDEDEAEGEGEGEGDEDDDMGGPAMMKRMADMAKHVPKEADETDEAYKSRLAKIHKAAFPVNMGKKKMAKKESQVVDTIRKKYPRLYEAVASHMRTVLGQESGDIKALKQRLLEANVKLRKYEDTEEARTLLAEASIPKTVLRAKDLIGMNTSEKKALIFRTKGLLQESQRGGSFDFGRSEGGEAGSLEKKLQKLGAKSK